MARRLSAAQANEVAAVFQHAPEVQRRRSDAIRKTQQARRAAAALRQRAQLQDRVPKHVTHCWHSGARDWWIYSWKKENASVVRRTPYQCESWRCPTCRTFDARVNYARFQQAAQPLANDGWCFLTLTVPRAGFQGWQAVDEAFKSLSQMSRNFFARLKRWMVRRGWYTEHERTNKKTGKVTVQKRARWSNEWIGVVEAHRSGWPHMHFALWSPELAEYLRENPTEQNLLTGELSDAAESTGWGNRCTLEPAHSRDRVASYLMKLSGEAGELQGELAKMTQLPTTAPVRFRRVRAGKGFLPPREKNEDYTGTMLRRRPDEYGISVEPIHRVADCPLVEHICCEEERRAMHNWAEKQPEKPVDSIAVPPAVVRSYHDARDAKGNVADRPSCAVSSACPISHERDGTAQGSAAGGLDATREEKPRCGRERRRARQPRLKRDGVKSAPPMSWLANTQATDCEPSKNIASESSAAPPPPAISRAASLRLSKELRQSLGGDFDEQLQKDESGNSKVSRLGNQGGTPQASQGVEAAREEPQSPPARCGGPGEGTLQEVPRSRDRPSEGN